MSSWKKASKSNQKTHRERHQPEARKHLGLLEKKKDYKLRAKDAHLKKKTLKLLHKRALNKNPDEFYHHMINSKMNDDSEHHEIDKPDVHSKDQLALMDTQDIKYIIMKRTIESNKIKRLQSNLHMLDVASKVKNKHTFFIDEDEDIKKFDLASRLETHPSLIQRKTNRPRIKDLEKLEIPDLTEAQIQKMNETREQAYKELKKRIEREKELTVVQNKMAIKKALTQKSLLKPKKIKAGTKDSAPVYKFKYERKR